MGGAAGGASSGALLASGWCRTRRPGASQHPGGHHRPGACHLHFSPCCLCAPFVAYIGPGTMPNHELRISNSNSCALQANLFQSTGQQACRELIEQSQWHVSPTLVSSVLLSAASTPMCTGRPQGGTGGPGPCSDGRFAGGVRGRAEEAAHRPGVHGGLFAASAASAASCGSQRPPLPSWSGKTSLQGRCDSICTEVW